MDASDDGNADLVGFDAAPAQRCVASVLSAILYARGSLPADCFRAVSNEQWEDPNITHEDLISSGKSLANTKQSMNSILAQDGPHIYLRKTENRRLRGVLKALKRIFAAVEERRLGKIQTCFSRSKTLDANALIEFYTLKFRYTKKGSMYIYMGWGGQPDLSCGSVHSFTSPLREFLRTRPPIQCTHYTHLFLFSADGKPLDSKQHSGLGKRAKDTVLILKDRASAEVRKIGTLAYLSPQDVLDEAQEAATLLPARRKRRLPSHEAQNEGTEAFVDQGNKRSKHIQLDPSLRDLPDFPEWLSSDLAGPLYGVKIDLRAIQAKYNCNLSTIDEASEDLSPTQPLPKDLPSKLGDVAGFGAETIVLSD